METPTQESVTVVYRCQETGHSGRQVLALPVAAKFFAAHIKAGPTKCDECSSTDHEWRVVHEVVPSYR